jgi:hypothetical protein
MVSKLACNGRPDLAYWPKPAPSETSVMVPFFVQIKCKLGQSYTVANALAEAEIASEIIPIAATNLPW